MTLKKYLQVVVKTHSGVTFTNPLKLSEAHFVSQLAQENESLKVNIVECTPTQYKLIFG
jgi:hypothetical protein